ncbi:LysR family transcriptional regulator [Pseudomonas sp. TH05]|uniref:LysR family transcriptional regulator n=1 Tax=unclassified Pseudomonas TaxID=196821 RepID=UPI001912D29E|nr:MULTISPECIES: LysR family transcriptional regulator [unclassified Pseudomonas]MBK5539672.1 LysR family transcriptional regulator [Pseudomonas sp. TH07]MBK5554787.1 LysR family transcriptional regulator [Pseudomonas sp. TH05]
MDTRKLRHVLGLVEHLTFSRASIEVNLSQPALSRSIASIEAELGVQLFDRGPAGVELTPYGRVFTERARKVLAELNELRRDIEWVRRGEYGEIALGFGPTAAALLKAPLLEHFARNAPRLRLTVKGGTYEELLRLLLEERIDIFFGDVALLSYRHDLQVDPLPCWRSGFFCRAGHPLLQGEPVSRAQLLAYPLGSIQLSAWAMADLEAYFECSIETALHFQTDLLSDLEALALAGNSVVFGSRPAFWQALGSGRLCEVPMDPPLQRSARFGSVSLAGRTLAPSVESAKAEAQKIFAGYAGQLALPV